MLNEFQNMRHKRSGLPTVASDRPKLTPQNIQHNYSGFYKARPMGNILKRVEIWKILLHIIDSSKKKRTVSIVIV